MENKKKLIIIVSAIGAAIVGAVLILLGATTLILFKTKINERAWLTEVNMKNQNAAVPSGAEYLLI